MLSVPSKKQKAPTFDKSRLVLPLDDDFNEAWVGSLAALVIATEHARTPIRCINKQFAKFVEALPCWAEFPDPKYKSLAKMFEYINNLYYFGDSFGEKNIPKVVLIQKGTHGNNGDYITIEVPISIVGFSREECVVVGGLMIEGEHEDDVNVSNLTLCKSKFSGIHGDSGASIHLKNVNVENANQDGIKLYLTKRNSITNCTISNSRGNGLFCSYGAVVKFFGSANSIHRNCTKARRYQCGVRTSFAWTGFVHFPPNSIKAICRNNGGGGDYVADCTRRNGIVSICNYQKGIIATEHVIIANL